MNVLIISYEKPISVPSSNVSSAIPTLSQNPAPSLLSGLSPASDDAFLNRIKVQASWAKVTSTTYLVKTNLSAAQMRDNLLNLSVDKFLVYEVTNQLWAANSLTPDVTQWLQNNWRQ